MWPNNIYKFPKVTDCLEIVEEYEIDQTPKEFRFSSIRVKFAYDKVRDCDFIKHMFLYKGMPVKEFRRSAMSKYEICCWDEPSITYTLDAEEFITMKEYK